MSENEIKVCTKCDNQDEVHEDWCNAGNMIYTGKCDGFSHIDFMRSSEGPCGRDGFLFEEKVDG